jgi:hypothetical protein
MFRRKMKVSENSTTAALAQRSTEKIHFVHKDMDYYLAWILGRQLYDASDASECMATAARIADGEVASWQTEWRSLAQRVERDAQAALVRGDEPAARGAFLRACTYYRAPLFIMEPMHLSFGSDIQKMRACFRAAAALYDSPIEAIEAPFQGRTLFG